MIETYWQYFYETYKRALYWLCLYAGCVLISTYGGELLLHSLIQVVLFTYCFPDVLGVCYKPQQDISMYVAVYSSQAPHVAF